MEKSCRKPDCLNTIRLIAALQVLYVHATIHLHLSMPEPVTAVIGFFKGVPIFFMLSGFLIWFSIGRYNSFGEYARRRFWRIYPELWCAIIVEAVVVVCLIGTPIDWGGMILFLVGQGTCFQFWTPDFLCGYGCGVPNGALWTICVLIQWYLCAFLFYRFLHGRSLIRWFVVLVPMIALGVVSGWCKSETLFFKVYENTFLPYCWMFLLAAFFAEHVQVIRPMAVRYWYVLVALTVMTMMMGYDMRALRYGVLNTIFLFLSCLGIGYAFPKVNIKTDISYGVYIYHMTIVNAMIVFGIGRYNGWLAFMALGAVMALSGTLAWLSTRFVGAGRMWGLRAA